MKVVSYLQTTGFLKSPQFCFWERLVPHSQSLIPDSVLFSITASRVNVAIFWTVLACSSWWWRDCSFITNFVFGKLSGPQNGTFASSSTSLYRWILRNQLVASLRVCDGLAALLLGSPQDKDLWAAALKIYKPSLLLTHRSTMTLRQNPLNNHKMAVRMSVELLKQRRQKATVIYLNKANSCPPRGDPRVISPLSPPPCRSVTLHTAFYKYSSVTH